MYRWLKISHHKHSGRLRPHEYTSYAPLLVLLVLVGVTLTICTAFASDPPPQANSVSLNGTMPGPAPTTAATIASPTSGQHFSTSPVTVTGTCPKNTLVEIYKNDIFAGSTPCGADGTYSLSVDLLIGQNSLVARVYDALNQPGPDSNPVSVFYDALPPQSASLIPLNFSGSQLLLNTDAVYRGIFPGQTLSIPINVIGGIAPYAITIHWGDGTSKIVPRNDNLTFNVEHVYQKPGTFQISLQATDSQGRVAFLTVAAIVNGQPSVTPVASTTKVSLNKLLVLWPLYTGTAGMVASFWLGERREKRLLSHVSLTPHPQG